VNRVVDVVSHFTSTFDMCGGSADRASILMLDVSRLIAGTHVLTPRIPMPLLTPYAPCVCRLIALIVSWIGKLRTSAEPSLCEAKKQIATRMQAREWEGVKTRA
jgi:hypothetical protein